MSTSSESLMKLAGSRFPQALRGGVFSICWWTALTPLCWSAPHDGDDHQHDQTPAGNIGTALVLPDIQGPKPWSDKPTLTDPNRFSIAIMTDNTGGHRPGIWMKAVERINWLRPDFVVSVGDLIEGYTEDDVEIARQWNEFLGFIDQMEMKFFFVAGNHDVTNPKLHKIWREQFGREWYSFDYKDVHFVCLCSEDPTTNLSPTQLEWLEHDLNQSKDARWTLVFLHKPLWTTAERDVAAGNLDSTNWTKAAELLSDRPHTVFAGHVHHYVQYQRQGNKYYSLATTGGSSPLRGVAYGEFDHITWLTMEKDGPHVANLLLDGIQPASVVTEDSHLRFRTFLQQVRLEAAPILLSDSTLQTGDIRIRLQNGFDQDVKVKATIDGLPLVGLSMKTQKVELAARVGEAIEQVVHFEMQSPVDLSRFAGTTLTAMVESSDSPPLRAEWTVPVLIDREYQVQPKKVALDGTVDEWHHDWWSIESTPLLAGAAEQWQGANDASFQLSARYDSENLYVAFEIIDEQVMAGDEISFAIDPRPLTTRLAQNKLGSEAIVVSIAAPQSETASDCKVSGTNNRSLPGVVARGKRTESGYQLEIALPIQPLVKAQGKDWSSFQMGARLVDVDAPKEKSVEVLWRAAENRTQNRPFAQVVRVANN